MGWTTLVVFEDDPGETVVIGRWETREQANEAATKLQDEPGVVSVKVRVINPG